MKAFPQKYPIDADKPHHYENNPLDTGMDLRDYFAAKALHGLLAAEQVGEYSNEHVAEISYVIADAMMKAREQ
jgi:hypothetical protein